MIARYMELLKFIFVVFMLTECFHSTKAMGLCDFEEKFPCEDNEGAICFRSPGCNKRTPSKPTDQIITKSPLCPPNMVYANCTTCQSSCIDPKGCITNCTETTTCVCSRGFLFKGGDCVLAEECDCFVEGEGVVPEGGFYVNADCTRRGVCNNSQITWDNTYMCSSNEVCEEWNNVRQCYSRYPADCFDIYNDSFTENGVYTISPTSWSGSPFQVYCNMTDGGGWTVFQRRVNGSVDFYRNWTNYKEGFGSPDHEHWLGNDKLYYLTNQKRYTIRIDLVNFDGSPYYAKFDYFKINDETDMYRLSQVGSYSGTADERGSNHSDAGISLSGHQGNPFSTHERDNDDWSSNCASTFRGAWWYGRASNYFCYSSNLNGPHSSTYECTRWYYLPGNDCNKFVEMKIRPF